MSWYPLAMVVPVDFQVFPFARMAGQPQSVFIMRDFYPSIARDQWTYFRSLVLRIIARWLPYERGNEKHWYKSIERANCTKHVIREYKCRISNEKRLEYILRRSLTFCVCCWGEGGEWDVGVVDASCDEGLRRPENAVWISGNEMAECPSPSSFFSPWPSLTIEQVIQSRSVSILSSIMIMRDWCPWNENQNPNVWSRIGGEAAYRPLTLPSNYLVPSKSLNGADALLSPSGMSSDEILLTKWELGCLDLSDVQTEEQPFHQSSTRINQNQQRPHPESIFSIRFHCFRVGIVERNSHFTFSVLHIPQSVTKTMEALKTSPGADLLTSFHCLRADNVGMQGRRLAFMRHKAGGRAISFFFWSHELFSSFYSCSESSGSRIHWFRWAYLRTGNFHW